MERIAEAEGYKTIFIEAHEDKSLAALLVPSLKKLLFALERMKASEKVRRGLAVLKSFVSAIKIKIGDFEVGLDIEAERGAADSGDIEITVFNRPFPHPAWLASALAGFANLSPAACNHNFVC